jgi:pimeloyl-ACP methyl ester carboxylesterase
MREPGARTAIVMILVALLAGCGPAVPTAMPVPPTNTPVPTTEEEVAPPEFEGKVDMGGYELYLHCVGAGSPTVVLEAGYDDTAETWALVRPEVAKFTRVCSYDRAGLGRSDPGPEPRDSLQIVKELRALLKNAGVEGPYVLVGHSLGGMYMRLFADRYLEDVVGLVLVDSAHIDQFRRDAMVLPPESPNESESLKFYRDWFTNPPTYPELPRRLFEPGSLGDMPLVVLTSPHKERAEDLPAGLSEKWDEIWVELQKEWAQISSRSTHVMAYGSGHFIQHDQPGLVIDAIRQIIEASAPAVIAADTGRGVLFIGNSHTFTNDLPGMFAKLARSGGREVRVDSSAIGGYTLEQHVGDRRTQKKLGSAPWDFVVLQESIRVITSESARDTQMIPAVRALQEKIRSPGAQTVLVLMWASIYAVGEGELDHFAADQAQTTAALQQLAQEMDILVAPVGPAWEQSLRQKPELRLWGSDNQHASRAGTYLMACVLYATIYQQSPVGLSFTAGLPEETVRFLQEIAAGAPGLNTEQ